MRASMGVLLALGLVSQAVAADGVGDRLAKAIQCQGEPQSAVSWLGEMVGQDDADAKITASGEDLAYRIDVTLARPITLAGASATSAVWAVEGIEDFSGVVYARFSGDAAAVAKQLELGAAKADAVLLGKFQREVPDGSMCPPTILLQPLQGTEFLLGCGWCNGG